VGFRSKEVIEALYVPTREEDHIRTIADELSKKPEIGLRIARNFDKLARASTIFVDMLHLTVKNNLVKSSIEKLRRKLNMQQSRAIEA
jgi:hypothetical protein